MTIVEALRAICSLVSNTIDPVVVAMSLGERTNDSATLMLVRPTDPHWRRIQVVVVDGRVDYLVLELAGRRLPIAALVEAFGEPEPEDSMDGPIVNWFDLMDGTGGRVGATVRRRHEGSPTTGELWVVPGRQA